MSEEEIREKLFGKKNMKIEEDINICPGCGNQFKRYIGNACTMSCYYRNVL